MVEEISEVGILKMRADGILQNMGNRNSFINLIPVEDFVGRDLKYLPDCPLVSYQAYEPFCEIFRVRENPQGCAVAVDDDRFALLHPVNNSVFSPAAKRSRNHGIVRVRWTHDGIGEFLLTPGTIETIFARDLVTRILPVGIGKRCRLCDEWRGGRFLIGRGGADEDKLPGLPAKELDIPVDVILGKGYPIYNGIPLVTAKDRVAIPAICEVRLEPGRPLNFDFSRIAIEQKEIDTTFHAKLAYRRADVSRSAYEENLQSFTVSFDRA